MKCSNIQKLLIEFENRELTPELQSHVHGCPECRKHIEQMDFVRQMIALKRYEKPAPGVEARCMAGIRRRIEQPDEGLAAAWSGLWEVLTGPPLPMFRYATAAAFAVLLLIHVLSLSQLPAVSPLASVVPAPPVVQARVAPPTVNFLRPAMEARPLLVLDMASNQGPAHIDYGPVPSTLVSYGE
jgi:hypothetical protein